MSVTLKRVGDQVIVITGASSGIGLATARAAARRGARLVLVSRNREALHQLATELTGGGAQARAVVADVGNEDDVKRVAREAVEAFGRIDTWVNNAGASIYGQMVDIATADHRRLMDTNFWGTVYGSLEAARHFRGRSGDAGGCVVNVGSVLSDRAVPVQGMYCASKFAIKGFTEALRMELEAEGVNCRVSLVKPSAIDTPFPSHARNYMDEEPTLPPPVYTPDLVAGAILHCAETGQRDVTVGGGGKGLAVSANAAPRLADRVMAATMPAAQKSGRPIKNPRGTLFGPTGGLKERGDYRGPVIPVSPYTSMAKHPVTAAALAAVAGVAAVALLGGAAKAAD